MTSSRSTLSSNVQLSLFEPSPPLLLHEGFGADSGKPRETHGKSRNRRDTFNARLLHGVTCVRPYEIPKISACNAVPDRLISFSEAMILRRPDESAWVHWYEDDYKFERVWSSYERYRHKLSHFAGVISPDFSLYRNMPEAQKVYNTYRNQLLGARMQLDGMQVIANVRVSGRSSIPYALAGTPRQSTLAVGLNGCIKSPMNRAHVVQELHWMAQLCSPRDVIIYGSAAYGVLEGLLESGVNVHVFAPDAQRRSFARSAA